jgi:hypothetical protein
VASFTVLLEGAAVWISMTIGTASELKSQVVGNSITSGGVAFLAGDVDVRSGQWILRTGMVKALAKFPVICVVALFAPVTQLPMMLVLVAGCASS